MGVNRKDSPVPHDDPKTINANLASNIEPLNVKYTRKYKKMFQKKNKQMNKSFTIWRPEPPEGYVSLGDITIANGLDPNNNLDSEVLSSQVKYPIHFNNYPICHLLPETDTDAKTENSLMLLSPLSLKREFLSGNHRHLKVILQ